MNKKQPEELKDRPVSGYPWRNDDGALVALFCCCDTFVYSFVSHCCLRWCYHVRHLVSYSLPTTLLKLQKTKSLTLPVS
jgi:predicted nucleic acid-binding Zn finger protein